MLSLKFPDFAGLCTIRDFLWQSFRLFTWSILYILAYFLLYGLSLSSTKGNLSIFIIILCVLALVLLFMWYKQVGKPYAIALAQRLHTHGKSCTRWVLIPNLIYAAICIIRVYMGEDIGNLATIGGIIDLIFFVYDSYITLICAFISGRHEAKAAAGTKNYVANLLVKNMRSARPIAAPTLSKQPVVPVTKVRTTSTNQEPVNPAPSAPPSHQ